MRLRAGQAQQYLGSLFDEITNLTDLEMALILEASVAPGSLVVAIATNLTTGIVLNYRRRCWCCEEMVTFGEGSYARQSVAVVG